MKVVFLKRSAGFCFGVKRALEMIEQAKKPIQVLGLLVHNPEVIRELENKGVQTISDPSQITHSQVAITAHGTKAQDYTLIKDKISIDTTCPFVAKLQKLASIVSSKGYQVVLIGDEGHPEVISVASFAKNPVVINTVDQAKMLGRSEKIALLIQTTQTTSLLSKIAYELINHTEELRVFNTICPSTKERQEDALKLVSEVGVMVIVGGKMSANTRRLFEICHNTGKPTFWIEGSDELTLDYLKQIRDKLDGRPVGLISGASTPLISFLKVVELLENS